MVYGLGFRVEGAGSRFWSLGSKFYSEDSISGCIAMNFFCLSCIWAFGFRAWVWCRLFIILYLLLMIYHLSFLCRVQGLGFRVSGLRV